MSHTQVQQPTFTDSRKCAFISMFVATSGSMNEVRTQHLGLPLPIDRDLFAYPSFNWLKELFANLGVPQTFFNGNDCDMVTNLSKMLRDTVLQHHGVHFHMYIMIFKGRCCYNVVPCSFDDKEVPLHELVKRIACENGKHSLPSGTTILEKIKIEDEKDVCSICLQEFNFGDDAAKLPCTHFCHYDCILEWFVKSATCPICRLACNQ